MKKLITFCVACCLFVITTGYLISPVAAAADRTADLKGGEITGMYTVILYGGRYAGDAETVAFLDPEGDPYTLEPYAPDFDYSVLTGLPSKDAFAVAAAFVSSHPDFWATQTRQILDAQGHIAGYEVRPLYYPLRFGLSDILDIDYTTKENQVSIRVRLKPPVERQLHGGDGSKDMGH